LATGFHCLGNGHHHAPVLKGAGGMAPLQLEIQLTTAEFLRQPVTPDQRGISLSNRENRSAWRKWQIVFVLNQYPFFQR